MALNPLYSIDQLPTTDQAAIREFNDRYLAALAAAVPTGWQDRLGALIPTASPMITFPVSQLRTLYRRSTGEAHFKKMKSLSFDVKTEEFDDGYEAKLKDLFNGVFAYRNWQAAPGRLVLAEEQFRATSVAAMLELGTATACVDGKNFFATDHPCNMVDSSVGTAWSNYQASTKDVVSVTNIAAEVALMRNVKDENGNRLGVDPDTILVPVEKYDALTNYLSKELILDGGTSTSITSAATTNPYRGRFKVEVIKEFTDVNDWYLVDSKMVSAGLTPWLSLRETVPSSLAFRSFDESSDYFKNTGNIKMTSHIWYGFSLCLPHAIRLIRGV